MRIRIWIRIQGAKPMQIQAKRILIRLLSHKKLNFYMTNILKYPTVRRKVQKPFFLKGRNPVLLANFGQCPCSWIRIRISNTDPDQIQPNEYGSMWIRIHNIGRSCTLTFRCSGKGLPFFTFTARLQYSEQGSSSLSYGYWYNKPNQ
jgi:hypothetical protein